MARLKVGTKVCTGAAAQITSLPAETSYWQIKAPTTNAGIVEIGLSDLASGQGYILEPGDSLEYTSQRESGANVYDTELNEIYQLGNSGDKITWLAHRV